MIQAPQVQYIPTQVPVQQTYQQPVANVNTQAYQVPNAIYNYPVSSCYAQPQTAKSQFNGVNIEIINPQGQGIPQGAQPCAHQCTQQGALTVPATFVPMNPMQIPTVPYQPVYTNAPIPAAPQVQQPVEQAPVAQIPTEQVPVAQTPVADATTAEVPVVPQPQIATEQPVATVDNAPVVEQPAPQIDPNLTPESFAGKLAVNDIGAQRAALEELALLVRDNNEVAPLLLDTQVFDALSNIINQDNSALEAPTPEVIALREKPVEELTPEEKAKAETIFPFEDAEENKRCALYTIAFMQERLNNELVNRGTTALELKDLPCIETVINTVKSNPNEKVRIGALASLAHIARPEYKQDLATIFEIAKTDENPDVQAEATTALEALNNIQ